jgi:outer membrane immunogenic protein
MNTKLIALAAFFATTSVLSTGAVAADVAPAAYDWSGFYLGAQGGYGWGTTSIKDANIVDGSSDYADTFSNDGFTGGVHAGYNYQLNAFVMGVEGDIELSDITGNNPDWPFGDKSKASIDAQGSLRLRLGYAADNFLFYGTGGLAFGDLNAKYYGSGTSDSFSNWETGWTVGAGVEYGFNENWSVNVEYRYTDFGTLKGHTANTDNGWYEKTSPTENTIRVGFSYHL